MWKNWLWGIWLPLTSHGCHSPIVGEGVGNCWKQKPELKTKPELQPQKGALDNKDAFSWQLRFEGH